MNDKKQPIVADVPKHRKKSKSKGAPRSKHKHKYKTVLLHCLCEINLGIPKIIDHRNATKVCEICGRIGSFDREIDKTLYEKVIDSHPVFHNLYHYEKTPEAIKRSGLEHWYANGYCPKTAYKNIEDMPEYEKLKSLTIEEM